jgi:phosphoribosylaminoimidazole-succinocarboxamide synthase
VEIYSSESKPQLLTLTFVIGFLDFHEVLCKSHSIFRNNQKQVIFHPVKMILLYAVVANIIGFESISLASMNIPEL